ncbi:uncharacterized protein LOC110630256 isoform X2 [Manihot esculenta]|uniref:uncharacterized protein LOC110630256 isoform X2 n=1 Tax=Manihot esculenta TaxID=3983 RepID=UPI000B5D4B18|nr:uncharacterized protein LOC110630256 isoform X2 [Manihot esculenta]
MSGTDKPRTVKLLCPSLSKTVAFAAWDDQKLDLGSIARAFGLDPSTLKLNGHFLSRGVDLVSSSVTWRSLLRFFSSKGLSTGKDDKDALIVHGKLCKSGRANDSQDAAPSSRVNYRTETEEVSTGPQPELVINFPMNKKLKDNNSGSEDSHQVFRCNGLGFKRKQLLEDFSLFKKLKINEANSEFRITICVSHFPELGERGKSYPSFVLTSKLKCSYMGSNVKRMREDEVILAAPCKRIR